MASLRATPPLLLEIDLTQPQLEVEPDDQLSKLRSRAKPRLAATLRALYEAGADARVGGIIAKVGTDAVPLAIASELREAVRAFAASGKPTVAWAETFSEGGNGTTAYYLASAFREIWLQPSGQVGLIGVASEVTFLRGVLDKVGVEPQLDKRYEFKNAADRIMGTELTEPHRVALDRLAGSAWETIVAAIAAGRHLDEAQVRALADDGPLAAARAHETGLVDRLGYRDEVYTAVRRQVGTEARLLFAGRWRPQQPPVKKVAAAVTGRTKPVVALIHGHGAIVTGRSRRSYDGPQMGSDTLAAAIRAARGDDRVRAVVFRVDSPGGSYIASDTVWREVGLTREAGKPVVVSMGTVAGSGGYFVACPADVIVAQPTTITGSIGVFGGKAVLSGARDKIGLGSGAVSYGRRARMYSTRIGFTDDERAHLAAELDAIYEDFVAKVAQGRGMTRDQVHDIAKGRVWSGADAAANGLVDRLGGLREATRIARERAGLPADAVVRGAVQLPMRARLRAPRSSDDPRAVTRAGATDLSGWGDLSQLASAFGLPAGGPLMMARITLA